MHRKSGNDREIISLKFSTRIWHPIKHPEWSEVLDHGQDRTLALEGFFWENKMEIREWKIRQWHRNNQREILYTNMRSKLKSRVGWDFRPRWGSNFGPERCFLRKNIEICKWKLCWWVRNDQDKIPYKNIQLVLKSDMRKVFCWSRRWRMSLENAFFRWIMRKNE